MSDPEKPTTLPFSSIYELLSFVAKRAGDLDAEAERKLNHERDAGAHNALIRERAQLILGLPAMLAEFGAQGGTVPQEVDDFAQDWSLLASRCLEGDNAFGMLTLLIAQRSGEPNALESLAAQYQPPVEPGF